MSNYNHEEVVNLLDKMEVCVSNMKNIKEKFEDSLDNNSKVVGRLEAMIEAFHNGDFELPNKINSENVNYEDMPEDTVYAYL